MRFIPANDIPSRTTAKASGTLGPLSLATALVVACAANLSFVSTTPAQTKHPSITWKAFNATGPELKQIGRIAVRHSKDIESSPWSVGCETLDRDYAKFSATRISWANWG